MRKQLYGPLIVSIVIIVFGIFGIIKISGHWNAKSIPINNPLINEINKDSESLDLKTIIHETEKHVIQVEGQNEEKTMTGSGFLYNNKGDIITNAHVIKDADFINIRTADAQSYPAAVVGIGDEVDIAVIRVPQLAGKEFLPIETESLAEIGDEVIALGSPHGFQNTVTLGIISGAERDFIVDGYTYENLYQISAQITHGNSGGPLISRDNGAVIGINSVGTDDGTIGFSIPTNDIIEQAEEWSNEANNDQLEFASIQDIDTYDPELLKEDADYLIDYFFDGIKIRDYVNAYTLLGSTMQSETSYSRFRDDYTNIVDLTYEETSNTITEDNQSESTIEVEMELKSKNKDKNKVKKVKYVFTIGLENDQLKILNISTP
ncbi:MAG TPA: S1C family serine protease [Virgibacillus sp.]|nr:S1C family serine protease [Virgibacillus sp.]